MEYFTLNNGTSIPALGIGTFLMEPDDAQAAVTSALQSGYELVDTANAYLNEKAVGRAIRNSGVPRDRVYLSTKLWPSVYAKAAEAINDTLDRLQTDYIDLLFLHQPVGDTEGAYRAIEDAVRDGKVRSIGLSNFPEKELRKFVADMDIRPAVIQTEAHPYAQRKELKTYLASIGAVLMAWYPLGHGDKALQQEPLFMELAEKYGKSTPQIILRWHVQNRDVVIPGSKNPDHIRANIDIFDFRLTDDEMQRIAAVNKDKRYYTATQSALEGYLAFSPDFDGQK